MHYPGAQVGMVNKEAGSAGRLRVVITLESHDISGADFVGVLLSLPRLP